MASSVELCGFLQQEWTCYMPASFCSHMLGPTHLPSPHLTTGCRITSCGSNTHSQAGSHNRPPLRPVMLFSIVPPSRLKTQAGESEIVSSPW